MEKVQNNFQAELEASLGVFKKNASRFAMELYFIESLSNLPLDKIKHGKTSEFVTNNYCKISIQL
jgi:hypothetical protein